MLWCTSASLFPDRQSRANAAVTQQSSYSSSPPTITYYLLTPHQPRAHTHTRRRHSRRLQLFAVPSIIHLRRPTASSANDTTPGVARFVSLQKTNSLGHHHQKVRSQLQTAIDRNPRRHSTDPPPRGNDTALLRTRRCSKIANKQALASCSQSRGHSSASE